MGKVKVRYYAIIKGRGYWQPTRKMRLFGFKLILPADQTVPQRGQSLKS